ncbi:MAG: ATP-binding protein [Paraclostridium sp.]|uniref:sensor histidine kinase n=1 Tax=Paraclostridium sp. TaxID=2023273 RepID=UPI003F3D07C8
MHKKMGKFSFGFLFVFIFILIITTSGVGDKSYSHNMVDDGFNVLVLNSYHQGHKWESSILEGLEEYVTENKEFGINFKVEYLDFRNNYDKRYIESFKYMLNEKYPRGSIDAIYTIDDEAYGNFSKEVLNEESNFYEIPLLFSGVDNKPGGNTNEKKYMAGIYHGDDSLSLMNLITSLNANTKTLNVIIENSKYGESIKFEINNLIDTYLKNQVKVRYIQSNYIQDICSELNEIPDLKNTVNIIAGEFQDKKSENYLRPKDTINLIKEHTDKPIYSNDQSYIQAGILGGHIDIGQDQATIIGDMIVQLKNGVKIENIKNQVEPKAKGYVDYNSIYEYKINPIYLHKDINIINKKPYELLVPTWMKYIITFLLMFFIISSIFIIRFLSKNRKEKARILEEQEKAKEREMLKSDFVVNLSHELRTPINVILGVSKVLEFKAKKGTLDNEYILGKLENINLNSFRLLKISNNIIDMTKAESGMLKLNPQNCNIVSVIEDVFENSIIFAKRKNITMTFDTKCEEIKTSLDVSQIQRVILNLLSNAIKFTSENGYIHLYIWTEFDNIVIEVIDSGVGIPDEKISYIFHNFYQVDNLYTRKNEGSGIGLSVIKEIIQMHKGKIEVESTVGEGSTFRIYLPIKIEENISDYDELNDENTKYLVDLEMSDI